MTIDHEAFQIRKLSAEDLAAFESLTELFKQVFEETNSSSASETHLQGVLGLPSFIALAAFVENKVIGGLTAYELPMYQTDSSEVLLYDLAVQPAYQRRGIAKQLLQHLKEYCSRNGIREFFVLAHEEDEHTLEFYRSTGGKGENVINFLYETAPGRE